MTYTAKEKKDYSIKKKNQEENGLANFVFDKEDPKVLEIEAVALGSLMLDKDAAAEIIDIIRPESFYLNKHILIAEAIWELFAESQPIDILTVVERLNKRGDLDIVGGAFYVSPPLVSTARLN